jgi:uncharacterized glyoxalase superfamily protein PhnB
MTTSIAVAAIARRVTDPADRRCGRLLPETVRVVPAAKARWGDGWVVIRPPYGVTWGKVARIARLARRGDWGPWDRAAYGDWS